MKLNLFICLLITSVSIAADATSKLVSKQNSFLDTITPDRVTYFTQFVGPSVQLNGNPYKSTGVENSKGIWTWNQVSLGYQITEKTRFVFNPRFNLYFHNETKDFELSEPVVGISRTWFKSGKFSVSGGLNTMFVPVRDSTKDKKLIVNPGGFQVISYQHNEKLSYGSWLWFRMNYYSDNKGRTNFPVMVAPNINYQITDTVSTGAIFMINGSLDDTRFTNDEDENLNLYIQKKFHRTLTARLLLTSFEATDFDIEKSNINLELSGRFF